MERRQGNITDFLDDGIDPAIFNDQLIYVIGSPLMLESILDEVETGETRSE
jgi:NAD(P)H-flavin reductase